VGDVQAKQSHSAVANNEAYEVDEVSYSYDER